MLLTDADAVHLKSWLVTKLETISEADSQILSDYVLALLQPENSEAELQANAIDNLTDFLGDKTKSFVQEVFDVIRSRGYIPGQESSLLQLDKQDGQHESKPTRYDANRREEAFRNKSRNRKRHYDDFKKGYMDWDAPNTTEEHNRKQFRKPDEFRRRAGPRGRSRIESFYQKEPHEHARETPLNNVMANTRGISTNIFKTNTRHNMMSNTRHDLVPSYGIGNASQAPQDSGFHGGGMAFDPNVALQAILTLQAMGFPMPFPANLSSTGQSPNISAPSPNASDSQTPCREYESKGVCVRGSSCHFKHQGHRIQGTNQDSDDAVGDITQAWDAEAAQKKYEARKALLEQTEMKRRELVAKQQEIELLKAAELQKMKDILAKRGKELPPDLEEASDTAVAGSEKTKQLLAQLKALEDEAKSLGLDEEPWFNGERTHHYSNAYRGRGSYRRGGRSYSTRGRGYIRGTLPRNGVYNLDNRPKQVRVEDVDIDTSKEESLKQFLFSIGDFGSVEVDANNKSYIATFKDRRTAETFYYGSPDIPDVGKAKLSWVTKPSVLSTSIGHENADMHIQQEDSPNQQVNPGSKDKSELLDDVTQREDDIDYGNEDYEWIV